MKNLYIIVSIIACFLLCSTSSSKEVITSSILTMEEGLPQNTVQDMVRDSSGFVWLATKNGLARYDGTDFDCFKINTEEYNYRVSNDFEQIVCGNRHCLWVKNSLGQVFKFDIRKSEFKMYPSLEENRGEKYIYAKTIRMSRKGDVFVVGANGGFAFISDSAVVDKSVGVVHSLEIDNEDDIFLMSDLGLYKVICGKRKLEINKLVAGNFFDCVCNDQSLICVSEKGKMICYDKLSGLCSVYNMPTKSDLLKVFQLSNSSFLVCSRTDGIFVLDDNFKVTSKLKVENRNVNETIENAWADERGDVWIKCTNTMNLYCYSNTENVIRKSPIYVPNVYLNNSCKCALKCVCVDKNGNIKQVPSRDRWYFQNSENNEFSYLQMGIGLYMPEGVLLSSIAYEGLQKNILRNNIRKFIHYENDGIENEVMAVTEDSTGVVWIAQRNGSLAMYDKKYNRIGYMDRTGNVTSSPCAFYGITSLYTGKDGKIWVGCDGMLLRLEKKGIRYDIAYYNLSADSNTNYFVSDIIEDDYNKIWMATVGDGIKMIDGKNGKIYDRHNLFANSYPPTVLDVNCLFMDENKNVWAGSTDGLILFSSDYDASESPKFFYYNPENTDMKVSNIVDIHSDKNGTLWLSAYSDGLFYADMMPVLGEIPTMKQLACMDSELKGRLVLSLRNSQDGTNWILTESGVERLSEVSSGRLKWENLYGLNCAGVKRNCFLVTSAGDLVLGTKNGAYIFDSKNLTSSLYSPNIVLSKINFFNNTSSLLTDSLSNSFYNIDMLSELELNSKQNFFTIYFSALDFRNESKIKYAYKLDGVDDEWVYCDFRNNATYTNLSPGVYLFHVKSSNIEGKWCENERCLKITIKPALHQTLVAKFFMAIIVLLIIGYIVSVYIRRLNNHHKLKVERDLADQKLQFFTDVSHELRTPLSLIIAPIEELINNENIGQKEKKQLDVINTNALYLRDLVDQLLDLRKMQNNMLNLKLQNANISKLVKDVCGRFNDTAEKRHINFSYKSESPNLSISLDNGKFSTIIINLLSNAFKFTPDGGSIGVCVSEKNNSCIIEVKDSGCGIPKEKISSIFDKFVTLKDNSLTNHSGTGLGLAIVKQLVELHDGQVDVISEENVGSTFRITIPVRQLDSNDIYTDSRDEKAVDCQVCDEREQTVSDGKIKLLVVEDNSDLRSFISDTLCDKYDVKVAENGSQGLDLCKQFSPDMIVSDIMMPVMDGIEMSRQIKNNELLSHIPIILLTAKTDIESKVECLGIGISDYVTKPFSMIYLEARIENILEERKRMQERYRKIVFEELSNTQARIEKVHSIEGYNDEVMDKIIDIIENEISNQNLSPDYISEKLKMSRWHLSGKIKTYTDLTAVELIREIRLKKSAKLLLDGNLSVSEIAYSVGMSDPRYFSRCFKQRFGVSPSEYKK